LPVEGVGVALDLVDLPGLVAGAGHPDLRILREAGLISAERRGTWVYYRVEPAVMARMSAVLVPQQAAMAAG
jgi:ArsR family transcriptional regulator, arsenate/arsenite/antimonite-responsive transcriptional repressor